MGGERTNGSRAGSRGEEIVVGGYGGMEVSCRYEVVKVGQAVTGRGYSSDQRWGDTNSGDGE
jgi:hypothetical protein